jgi:predicted amidohydrolase YtcJ
VSLEDALRAYTRGAARAIGDDSVTGRIAVGRYGDFVVLSRDLLAIDDPMEMLEARVVMTVVGGEVVYKVE